MTSFSSVYRSMIAITIVSCSFVISVSAAGTIPRDSLRLELSLATGSLDTSGNNRPVTATGVAPSYQVDSTYAVPYAQFNGSGGLRVNTAWNATNNDNFAVSFWIKKNTPLSNSGSLLTDGYITTSTYATNTYTTSMTYLVDPIFMSSSGSTGADSLRLLLSRDGKCTIRGIGQGTIQQAWYNYRYDNRLGWVGWHQTTTNVDYGNNISEGFNCSALYDSKWHHIVMNKKGSSLSFVIDGNEVFLVNGTFQLPKDLLIGYSNHFDPKQYPTSGFSAEQMALIRNAHNMQGGIAGFRLYSRSISSAEIEALGDEYRYAQSDLVGAGNITLKMNGYSIPNLSISLGGIAPNLSKDIVEYQYSLSGSSFLPITDITDISANTGSLQYRVMINMSTAKDGKNTVILRVKSGETYQNLGTVTFTKLDTLGTITINQPTTDIASSKIITASTDIGNTLYMFQTRGTVCDGTITTWEDYSDLTFVGKSDNGIRICYKSVNTATNKIIYKLSATIQGIQSTEDQKEKGFGLFSNYALWAKSLFPKSDDSTAMILELLNSAKQRSDSYNQFGSLQGYSLSSGNNITMTDINGDGLVDFLYSNSGPVRRAIVVNNGNYTFKTVYKCAIDAAATNFVPDIGWVNSPITYYGDCADPTR